MKLIVFFLTLGYYSSAQLAPLPYKAHFVNNELELTANDLIAIKNQVDSTKIVLKMQKIKYEVVNVSSYDSIYSEELDKLNRKRYTHIKKQLVKYGVKRCKIVYKPHYFDLETGLSFYGPHWKVAFLL